MFPFQPTTSLLNWFPSRFIVNDSPIRTTLRFSSSAPLRCALRCAEWAALVVFLLSLRGGNTFSKTPTKRRSKEDGNTNTISRHSEVVSLTRGSSQQTRPDHGRIQCVLELQRRKSNPCPCAVPTARH